MTPTIEWVASRFDHFNNLCFDGSLPRPAFRISHAKTFLGQLSYKRRRKFLGRTEFYNFVIRISDRLDLPEEEVEDTLLHEMIHYHIAVGRLKDSSTHGRLFRAMMDELNRRYNRHITISHRSTAEQREAMVSTRPRRHIVALVDLRDGRTGLKVLPYRAKPAADFFRRAGRADSVASVAFFLTDHPYFNRYPCSSALRVSIVDRAEVEAALSDASHPSRAWKPS